MYSTKRRLRILLLLPVAVLIIGTIGFVVFEKLSFADAIYFTIVTISTVGYGDIHPTTFAGKVFGIFLIIIGIGTFLTVVTGLTQLLVQRGQEQLRRERQHMIIGVFFTEVGNQLLRLFVRYNPSINVIRQDFQVSAEWTEVDYTRLKKQLPQHNHVISSGLMELQSLRDLLEEKGELFLRQIENPDLIEHESFTELLWAVVHLRDEIMARQTFLDLPETDLAHLVVDAERAYNLLVGQWLDYLQHLKQRYPYLFSLALRTNPFSERQTVIIQ